MILREAGGRLSGFGGEDHLDSGDVVASNGLLHEAMVEVVSGEDWSPV